MIEWGGGFKGLHISQVLSISHFAFVDDILIFCDGSRHDYANLSQGLNLFQGSTGMQVNERKNPISTANLNPWEIKLLTTRFSFPTTSVNEVLKYFGF